MWGEPVRISSTESKIPGMYKDFSKSQPEGTDLGTDVRNAPTRTRISFSPGRSAARASNSPGVKLPGWSPNGVPFSITRKPNIALWTLSTATAGRGPSTRNVRRYQNASRNLLWTPTAAKAGRAMSTSPGTVSVCEKSVGTDAILPCSTCHVPSSEITWRRAAGSAAQAAVPTARRIPGHNIHERNSPASFGQS